MKKSVLYIFSLIFTCFFFFFDTAEAKESSYLVEISLNECKMRIYEFQSDDGKKFLGEYEIATVKKGIPAYPQGLGYITKVEENPTWYPTAYTRQVFSERGVVLPKIVLPGDKLNYMGSFKIHLSHFVPGKGSIYRIHGNNDPSKIGKRATGGCIRMKNKEGLDLIRAGILKKGARVNIFP